MFETIASETAELVSEALRADIDRACEKIPPLWDLPNYVAVNPFLGFSEAPIAEACREIGDGLGAAPLPGMEYYRQKWDAGAFGPSELAAAARRAGADAGRLADVLSGVISCPARDSDAVLTFAERHDRRFGTNWHEFMLRSAARWCAVHASGGGVNWPGPDPGRGLYDSWREAAGVDRSPEIAGLAGWRGWARRLPEEAAEAIADMLSLLGVSHDERGRYFYRLLGGLYGWASFFRRASWQSGEGQFGDLEDLLAIRICTDAAVASLAPRPAIAGPRRAQAPTEDEATRLLFQDALEDRFAGELLGKVAPPDQSREEVRPDAQAFFCIDVRSEPMRRHLEAQSSGIETGGFAGFFGVALEWQAPGGGARCPVLLKPGVALGPEGPEKPGLGGSTVKFLQSAPAASFTFVEALGLAYGIGLAADSLSLRAEKGEAERAIPFNLEPDGAGRGIDPELRLSLAAGILKNMGLGSRAARLVVLCGHDGRSANNPHRAGLACGACGGHGGALNARVAAAILNDPSVRAGLPSLGAELPADTVFLAAVHDTSTDEVTVLDADRLPASHSADLSSLRDRLAKAGLVARAERAASLGLRPRLSGGFLGRLRRRARDWSEVRPEWGLARNAAFIAARRRRTRGRNLQGRAFLHDYDCTRDPDNSVLALILSAPMVVASWINLQYFASTVDNRVFGCGTKALHNRVGSLGVVLGNGGDLRTGLPIQSVHAPDGRWFHEPLRLQVVVESTRERIDEVLAARPSVRNLVENGWVRLFALDPDGGASALRLPGGGWEVVGDGLNFLGRAAENHSARETLSPEAGGTTDADESRIDAALPDRGGIRVDRSGGGASPPGGGSAEIDRPPLPHADGRLQRSREGLRGGA